MPRPAPWFATAGVALLCSCGNAPDMSVPNHGRVAAAKARVGTEVSASLAYLNLAMGNPVVLVAFKEERQLEAWCRSVEGDWILWKTFPILAASGRPGPKEREGDMQVPEGEYGILRKGMNPASQYHLGMNIGYPNKRDLALGRTGSAIMIHGSQVSVGCLAMGDDAIERLYLLVDAALAGGEREIPVHIFPFRMTPEACAAHAGPDWHPTWDELKLAHARLQRMLAGG
jgi:murein L,D-transpeptidase YafK